MVKNCENVNCRYRTSDALCRELKDQCRVYIQFKYEQDMRKESEAEIERYHQLNDIRLAHIGNEKGLEVVVKQ